MDRRAWVAGATRCGLLGGLAVLSGHLLARSQPAECRGGAACRHCGQRGRCGLPQAIATRRKVRG